MVDRANTSFIKQIPQPAFSTRGSSVEYNVSPRYRHNEFSINTKKKSKKCLIFKVVGVVSA